MTSIRSLQRPASSLNASAADYHLTPSSPAIDKGTSLNDVTADLEGNPRPSGITHDIGAYEFQPALVLNGKPGNRTIYLNWSLNTTLPVGGAWRITYYSQTVASTVVATDPLTNTARAFTLTGLTNYAWYTVTFNAMLDSTPIFTDTVRVMPTDQLVYLPLVLR